MVIKMVLILLFSISSLLAKADGTLISWGPKDIKGMTNEKFEASKNWTIDEIITKNVTVEDWGDTYLLLVAANQHKDKIIKRLIDQLENPQITILKRTSRLIIWERIISGDIFFEGKGLQISDDLFSVAGRANWLLRNLTSENLGFVKPTSDLEELKALKSNWEIWSKGKKVKKYQDPYKTKEKGLKEIKSIEALNAIILSLKNSDKKENLIKNCLSKMYNLDKLPNDPSSPANYCSPDTYSYMYLLSLTKIEEKHDAEWWNNWWLENSSSLVWNKMSAKFEISRSK